MVDDDKRGGGFFAIDRRTWSMVCDLGLNEACMYLVLASGTGRDNRSTRWSANAGMSHAGIRWERGKPAIERLIKDGLIRRGEGYTQNRPRYDLPTFAEVSRQSLEWKRSALSRYEQELINQLHTGEIPQSKRTRQRLRRLLDSGAIFQQDGEYVAELPAAERDPIWLPNTVVTGTDKREESPIRRLRNCGDVWTLRLFVDLYHSQNLRDDGGISPWVIRQEYERVLVGERGIFKIWAFRPDQWSLFWTSPFLLHRGRPKQQGEEHPVWETVGQLTNMGLLSFVPHLWNSWDDNVRQAEIIHPFGIEGIGGEKEEIEIGDAAQLAGRAMVIIERVKAAFCESRNPAAWMGRYYLAPTKNTLPNVQMIGVGRLTYRPHTLRTASWWAELKQAAPGWVSHYQQLCEKAEESKKVAVGA